MTKFIRRAADTMVSAIVPKATAAAACEPRCWVQCGRIGSCGTIGQMRYEYCRKASCDTLLIRKYCMAICHGG